MGCLAVAVSAEASASVNNMRPDLVAGGKFLEALDHDLVAGLQSFGHEPLAVLHRSGAHRLHRDAVVVLDHEHFAAAAAIALDRLLRHRDGVGVDALLDQDADIHARQQFALRIGKFAAQGHLPGMGIDPGVREQQLAGAAIDRAIVEHQAHPGRIGRDAVEFAALERAPELIEFGDRLREIGIDRIELLNRREIGLVLHHQRAFADQRRADHAIDRGADRGVAQIELGARDFRLASLDLGFGLPHAADGFFIFGVGGGALAGQRRNATRLLRRLVECRNGLGERRLAGLHFDLERPRIDPVERIAGLDLAALVEQALDDDAGNPRTHVGNPGRRDAPRQFAHQRARLGSHGDNADFGIGRLCCCDCGERLIASGKKRRHRSQHQGDACRLRAKSSHERGSPKFEFGADCCSGRQRHRQRYRVLLASS